MNSSVQFRKNEDLSSCVGTRGQLDTLMPRPKQVHSNTASRYFFNKLQCSVIESKPLGSLFILSSKPFAARIVHPIACRLRTFEKQFEKLIDGLNLFYSMKIPRVLA